MGWSNYIIIQKLKWLIEISRNVEDLAEYEETAIKIAIDEDNLDNSSIDEDRIVDMGDVEINKITIRDLAELYKRYDIIQSLSGMDDDKLLLFWLKNREIEFDIKSEFNIKLDDFEKEGYLILRR